MYQIARWIVSGESSIPQAGSYFVTIVYHLIFRNFKAAMNQSNSPQLRKRILVTGGAGFLGSHLCERLLRDGADVICMDNYFTGNKQNVQHLMNNPSFELMRHDVTFPTYLEVDEIYNLACPASPIHYQHDPVQTTKTSVHWCHQYARACKAHWCKNFPGIHQ